MLILCWNVAGWPTTQAIIGDVATFFQRHHADIVCIQEAKVSKSRLSYEGRKLCASIPGWESFWSCCSESSSRGFNGVTTWAKVGLVLSANSSPLDDAKLNSLGRCIRTDHPHFVLFNIYTPTGRSGLSIKMNFLRAVRRAMKRARETTGKPVILAGDLNISSTTNDVPLSRCRILVDKFIKDKVCCQKATMRNSSSDLGCLSTKPAHINERKAGIPVSSSSMPNVCDKINHMEECKNTSDTLQTDKKNECVSKDVSEKECDIHPVLTKYWPEIVNSLDRMVVKEITTKSSKTQKERQRYAISIPVKGRGGGKNEWFARIGELIDSPDEAKYYYRTKEVYWEDGETESDEIVHGIKPKPTDEFEDEEATESASKPNSERGMLRQCRPGNAIALGRLVELLRVIGHVEWSESTCKRVAKMAGEPPSSLPEHSYLLHNFGKIDGMTDTFRYVFPNAIHRYTCWHQYTNQRYVNEGARIDYFFIDSSILPAMKKGSEHLRCGCRRSIGQGVSKASESGTKQKADTQTNPLKSESKQREREKSSVTNSFGSFSQKQKARLQYERHILESETSKEAALCACTANGRYAAANFDGGGISDVSSFVLDLQFDTPCTGLVYTPPKYSDHIALSLLLDDKLLDDMILTRKKLPRIEGGLEMTINEQNEKGPGERVKVELLNDKATRASQPHKSQLSIRSFFGAFASSSSDGRGKEKPSKDAKKSNTVDKGNVDREREPCSRQRGVIKER